MIVISILIVFLMILLIFFIMLSGSLIISSICRYFEVSTSTCSKIWSEVGIFGMCAMKLPRIYWCFVCHYTLIVDWLYSIWFVIEMLCFEPMCQISIVSKHFLLADYHISLWFTIFVRSHNFCFCSHFQFPHKYRKKLTKSIVFLKNHRPWHFQNFFLNSPSQMQ